MELPMKHTEIENLLINRGANLRIINTLQKFLSASTAPPDMDKFYTGHGEGFIFFFDHGMIEVETRGDKAVLFGIVSNELNIDSYDFI